MSMLRTSEQTGKLDKALAQVQANIKIAIEKDTNPQYRSRYADLRSVWDAIRPAVVESGISVTQWPHSTDENWLQVTTRVAFEGEWIEGTFSVPVDMRKGMSNVQAFGSAVTYAKRYALGAIFGVVSGEDDDGEGARQAEPTAKYMATEAQKAVIVSFFNNHAIFDGNTRRWISEAAVKAGVMMSELSEFVDRKVENLNAYRDVRKKFEKEGGSLPELTAQAGITADLYAEIMNALRGEKYK